MQPVPRVVVSFGRLPNLLINDWKHIWGGYESDPKPLLKCNKAHRRFQLEDFNVRVEKKGFPTEVKFHPHNPDLTQRSAGNFFLITESFNQFLSLLVSQATKTHISHGFLYRMCHLQKFFNQLCGVLCLKSVLQQVRVKISCQNITLALVKVNQSNSFLVIFWSNWH